MVLNSRLNHAKKTSGTLPSKWSEFFARYVLELQSKKELVEQVLDEAKHAPVTLFYAAKDTQHSHALVLLETLKSWPKLPKPPKPPKLT